MKKAQIEALRAALAERVIAPIEDDPEYIACELCSDFSDGRGTLLHASDCPLADPEDWRPTTKS